jgi:hypothetical protein
MAAKLSDSRNNFGHSGDVFLSKHQPPLPSCFPTTSISFHENHRHYLDIDSHHPSTSSGMSSVVPYLLYHVLTRYTYITDDFYLFRNPLLAGSFMQIPPVT